MIFEHGQSTAPASQRSWVQICSSLNFFFQVVLQQSGCMNDCENLFFHLSFTVHIIYMFCLHAYSFILHRYVVSWLDSSFLEHCFGITEVMGSNPFLGSEWLGLKWIATWTNWPIFPSSPCVYWGNYAKVTIGFFSFREIPWCFRSRFLTIISPMLKKRFFVKQLSGFFD